MIDPKPEDIGRAVIHRPDGIGAAERSGVITAISAAFVYVRFKHAVASEGILRNQLYWATPRNKHSGFKA